MNGVKGLAVSVIRDRLSENGVCGGIPSSSLGARDLEPYKRGDSLSNTLPIDSA